MPEKIEITANILFSGIGFQEWGFRDTPYDLKVVNTSEINKESILSYACIHNGLTPKLFESYNEFPSWQEMVQELSRKNIGYDPVNKKPYAWESMKRGKRLEQMKKFWLADKLSKNLGDISRIKSLSYADLWFSSFPCQSISNAGKMRGFKPDSGTRSSLLWDNIRLLKTAVDSGTEPKVLMFENVKALVSKKFYNDFMDLLDIISGLGYKCFWDVLNAKECGVPQNRERVFIVCFRNDICPDWVTADAVFPKPFGCKYLLEDILDPYADEKYYIDKEKEEATIKHLIEKGELPEYE